jgi:hypothetical protein
MLRIFYQKHKPSSGVKARSQGIVHYAFRVYPHFRDLPSQRSLFTLLWFMTTVSVFDVAVVPALVAASPILIAATPPGDQSAMTKAVKRRFRAGVQYTPEFTGKNHWLKRTPPKSEPDRRS